MRLLTHNFLQSNVKGTDKGYPLQIEATEVVLEESPMDTELLLKLLFKLDYAVLLGAVHDLDASSFCTIDLPTLPPTLELLDNKNNNNNNNNKDVANDDDTKQESLKDDDTTNKPLLLNNLHMVLMDVHILEGNLICPDTGRKFPIKEGIPNMILHEDEV